MKKTNSIGLKILMFVFVFVMFVSVAPKLNTADAYLRDIVPSGVYGGWGTSYTMGYRFTPQSNGQITHLWCYSAGTSTVTLWSDAGSQLASTSINCNAGWVSGAITPVSVTSGTYYRVTVWGSNYYGTISVPNSTTGITIDSGYYSSGSNVFPTNNSGQTMYGMADVTLSAGGGGSCTLFPGSQIATSGNETTVAGWLGGTPKQGTLIYRRSTNGSASSTFHSLVDGQGETISLIKTTNNRVIGGYNPNSWSSSSAYDTGSAGFLFNLTYGFRLTNTNSSYMTYNYNSYGPCFGGGHDMCVNSSTTASGYNGTHSYQNPSTYGYSYLEGAYSWNVSDIEVYKLSTTCSGGGPIVTTTGSGGYSYNYFYASGTVNPGAESDVLGAYRYGTSNVACTSLPNSGTAGSWLTTNTVNTINVYISANPSTTYYYCIGAYDNSTGSYTWSSTTSSVTTSAPQIPTMERVTKGEITTTTASITGNIAAENGASITAKGICYSSTNTTPAVGQGGTTCTSNGTGTAAYTASITGLTANTLYYFRSYATNSAGSGYSGADTFTTETTPPAGFPQVVSTTGLYDRVNSTTHNVPMPAIVDSGDLLLALTSADGTGTINTPSGWTQLYTTTAGQSRTNAFYKFASGTEDGTTVNFTTGASEILTATVYRITGALSIESGTAATSTSANPNPPSLTPSWGAKDTLWISFAATDNGYIRPTVYPANYTHGRWDGDTYSSSTSYSMTASARRYLNAISEDPGTFTLSSSDAWSANTIAIRPIVLTPSVTTDAASSVTQTTATLNGTGNPNGYATTGWFRYYTSNPGTCSDAGGTRAPASSGSALGSGSTGVAYSQGITGLTPGTDYWSCAIASNANGTGVGSPVQFTTAVGTPTSVTAGSAGQTSPWYNNSWDYRIPITVLSAKVDANLTDFPVYVDLSNLPAAFFTNVKSDGSDIRITTSDTTTEVPREVVTINTGAGTGELHFKGTISSSSNTTFYIYYGNAAATEPAASATYGSQNVWNSAYKGVYHLANGTTLSPNDSTATAINGTITQATATTGQIDGGGNFDGINDKIDINSVYGLGNTNVTISAWANLPDTSESGAFVKIGNESGSNIGFALGVGNTTFDTEGNNLVMLYEGIRWINTSSALGTGKHYAVMTVDASGVPSAYKDGVFISSYSGTNAAAPTTGATKIGGYTGSGAENRFGQYGLDEVRISNTPRASTWISTEYNNQSSPSTFYSVGSEENLGVAPPATGSYYATLEGSANPNNFASYGFFELYNSDPGSCLVSDPQNPPANFVARYPSLEGSDSSLGSTGTSQNFSYEIGSGLTPNTTYYYCAFARNAYGTVGSSGTALLATPDGPTSPCDPPAGGNHTISSSCSYSGSVGGVDAGTGTNNTATLIIGSTKALTMNPAQQVAWGSISMQSGASINLGSGSSLRRSPVWVVDADADGKIGSTEQYIGAQPAGGVRRNTVSNTYAYFSKILSATSGEGATYPLDCDDASQYAYRTINSLVTDADNDGYKTSAAASNPCVGDSSTINGRTYYKDASNNSSWLPDAQKLSATADCQDNPNGAPCAPTTTSASNPSSQTQNNISWSGTQTGGAVPATTGYDIEWCTGSSCTPPASGTLTNVTSTYAHTGRSASTTYGYRVVAKNANGSGTPSSPVRYATTTAACVNTTVYTDSDGDGNGNSAQITLGDIKYTNSSTLNMPSGVENGTVLIAATNYGSSVTTPSGWTLINSQTYYASANVMRLYYRKATGAETTPVTFTGITRGFIIAYNGVDFVTQVDGSGIGGYSSYNDNTIYTPSFNTSTSNTKVVLFGVNTNGRSALTTPSGYTLQIDTVGMQIFDRTLSGTSLGSSSYTTNGSSNGASSLAVALRKSSVSTTTQCVSGGVATGAWSVNQNDCNDNTTALYRMLNGYADRDGDGYTSSSQYSICSGVSLPTGYVSSPAGSDCSDAANAYYQNVTCYPDQDNDTYSVNSPSSQCSSPGVCPPGYKTTLSNPVDCYDGNASAYPGQVSYFTTNRGDGSFDYDCSNTVTWPAQYDQYLLGCPSMSYCGGSTSVNCGTTQNYYQYCACGTVSTMTCR